MKRILSFPSRSLLSVLLIFSSINAIEKKPWTFFVYLAAANDLNYYSDKDIAEMMKIGSNNNVNIVVYLTQGYTEPKFTKLLYINKGGATQIGKTTAEDSGNVRTLMKSLELVETNFPSDYTAIVFWDHGSGPLNRSHLSNRLRGICYDYDSDSFLTDGDCLQALTWAMNTLRSGKKYDIIAYDACLMSSIETAFTLADVANYLVASQETIPGDGYQYAYVLDDLVTSVPTPKSFAQNLVLAYDQEYNDPTAFTLSAIDLSQVKSFVYDMNQLNQILINGMMDKKNGKNVKNIVKKCKTLSFDSGTFADLYSFYSNLNKNSTSLNLSKSDQSLLKTLLTKVMKNLQSMVIAKVSSKPYKSAGGLSVYFPKNFIESSYARLYWSKYSNWLTVLKTCLS